MAGRSSVELWPCEDRLCVFVLIILMICVVVGCRRARFVLSYANASQAGLKISSSRLSDQGMYRCEITYLVINEPGCPTNQYVNLTVLGTSHSNSTNLTTRFTLFVWWWTISGWRDYSQRDADFLVDLFFFELFLFVFFNFSVFFVILILIFYFFVFF